MRAYVAEFIGTFIFFLAGTGAVLGHTLTDWGAAANVAIPLAFGFGLVVAIFGIGHISGGHLNPAVTIALAVRGKGFSWAEAPGYIVAQLLASLAVAAVLAFAFGTDPKFANALTLPGANVSAMTAGVFEFLATFALMTVIMGVATDSRGAAPAALAIGLTVSAMAFGVGWISGGSFNPARSFGPALLSGNLSALWIYFVFPVLGAIAATFTYDFIRGDEKPVEGPVSPTVD